MIDARNINDLAARIKHLGMGIQSGQIEGTAQNVMHLMHLKEELQKARAMQNSAMANAPKPPTVMNQVASSAVQDADQAQAQSVQDMMKQRALAMQGEMAGTGGIGDFVKEPEKKMALGGAVAFAGLTDSYVDPKYSRRNPEMFNRFWTYENSPEYEEYKRKYGLKGVLEKAGSNIGEGASNLYQNAKGLVAATPEIRDSIAQKYAAEAAARNRKMLDAIDWYGTENQPQVPAPALAPQAVQSQATQAPAPLAPMTGAGSQVLNTAAQSDNRDMASRMQLRAPQTDNVATKYGTTVPAGAVAQLPSVQQPAEERAHVDTAQEEIAKLRSLMGESSYAKDVEKRLADREARLNEKDNQGLGMALMNWGINTAAGRSSNALTNIAEGAKPALEGYVRDKNRLEDKREALDDARLSLAKAQEDQKRAEVMYGLNSERANKAADRTERHQDKVLDQQKELAYAQIELQKQHYAGQAALGKAELEAKAPYYQAQAKYLTGQAEYLPKKIENAATIAQSKLDVERAKAILADYNSSPALRAWANSILTGGSNQDFTGFNLLSHQ